MSAFVSRDRVESDSLTCMSPEGIADRFVFPEEYSRSARIALLAASTLTGVVGAVLASEYACQGQAFSGGMLVLALVGGVLSTWSPCGYSSLCLLRPVGRYSFRSLAAYTPTFLMHGAGYVAGALLLGSLLGTAGAMVGFVGASFGMFIGLGTAALVYGAHQFGFLCVPYPQRRAQVPHDARQRFPMWFIGGLYGLSLGLNYLTYVQTPILYIVTAAAALGGDIVLAVSLFLAFNAGRFLPMIVNYLPISDSAVQNWLACRQEDAAILDGALLVAAGAAMLTFAVL